YRDTGTGSPAVSAEDLARLRVAGVEGYEYWDEFDAAVGTLETYPTTHDAMVALAQGEVDIVAEGHLSGLDALASPGFTYDARGISVIDSSEPWAKSEQALYFMMAPRPGTDEVMA